jgi:predicted dehydrogenase
MESVRIAVFGQGFARSVILPCLRQVSGARVVGLAGRSAERLRVTSAEFGIELASTSHREILERGRPDLAIVATPPHLHAEMAIDALRAGCHVLCEKPMAVEAGETARMVAQSERRADRLAWIDHELRFLPARARLLERIERGDLGRILRAEYVLHTPLRRDPASPWSWWSDAACGGGIWGAIGSHAVDALRLLCGEIAAVRGRLVTAIPERTDPETGRPRRVTADDVAEAWLSFASGASGTITLSAVEAARVHRLTVSGEAGWAQAEEQRPLLVASGREPARAEPIAEALPASAALGIPDTDWARAFLRLARRMTEAIRTSRGAPEAAGFRDGHRVQRVLDAVRRSAAVDAWVEVAPD